MNQRLEGWKLALAVLIPAAVIAAAIFIAYQALTGDDDQSLATGDDVAPTTVPTVIPTAPPQTQPVDEPEQATAPTPVTIPTVDQTPTPLPVPTPEAEPTTAPAPTVAPAPTTAPPAGGGGSGGGSGGSGGSGGDGGSGGGSGGSSGGGGVPTPTVDPDAITLTCSSASGFPSEAEVGQVLDELNAVITPAELQGNYRFNWDFGDGRVAGAPNTGGLFTYDMTGRYNVTLTATETVTGEVLVTDCGRVKVGNAVADVRNISCSVKPENSAVKFEDATPADRMMVTVTWRPAATPLTLQYEFEANDPIIFEENVTSPSSRVHAFRFDNSTFKIFWRDAASGETGTLECPAFPAPTAPEPTTEATVEATATATPTPTPTTTGG